MIKTWQQRCDEHPDHNGIVTDGMIQARMQEEIDELRAAIEQAQGKHEDWCASLTQLLLSMPPKPAPCNCKSKTASPRRWQKLTEEEIARRESVNPIRVRIMQEAYDLADRDDSEGYNSVKVMCSEVLGMINKLLEERKRNT